MTSALITAIDRRSDVARDKLHVLYGVLSLDLGGLERVVLDLVRENHRRGHRTTVACIERRGKLAAQVEEAGGQVETLDKPSGRSREAVANAAALLMRLAPDVVHTHQIGALCYLGQAARRLEIPVVHTEHSDHIAHSASWLGKAKAWLRWRHFAPLADRFCCVSDDIASTILRWQAMPSRKVRVVLNGIDLRTYEQPSAGPAVRAELGIPPGALVIGTVGRLAEVKRQDLLLRSFAELHKMRRQGNGWLLLVGDGPERGRLEHLATSLGIGGRTVFAGYQAEPQRFLQAMDLFALTSRHEGLPLALLEAWATRLAVVASAVGGIPQTVVHGVNGLLFESGSQLGLRETLEGLLDSPSLIRSLGEAGRADVERRYSLARMADDYEAAYRSLLAQQVKEQS